MNKNRIQTNFEASGDNGGFSYGSPISCIFPAASAIGKVRTIGYHPTSEEVYRIISSFVGRLSMCAGVAERLPRQITEEL